MNYYMLPIIKIIILWYNIAIIAWGDKKTGFEKNGWYDHLLGWRVKE